MRSAVKPIIAISTMALWIGRGEAAILTAQTPAGGSEERSASVEPGFKTIFNGTDLTGWKGDTKIWSVRDGVITGQTSKESGLKHNNFLIWQGGELADFELRLKFRLEGGNSGIYFHSKQRPEGEPLVGPQADFSADGRWTGVLMEYLLRDVLAERGQKVVIDEKGKKHVVGSVGDSRKLLEAVDLKKWNDYRVLVKDGRVVLEINGLTMCEVQDNDPKRPGKGLLAVQVHVGPPMRVQFKGIRLRTF